ncbi:hypothetical protein GLOIN_2v1639675 [Rhizophagus clarus]|uniref:Uncharacterized protein n=1 Tax=Rhizophagus clarus TaxID=94130 RepID=A0A8H3QW68_9GLOM|nr:hypothetical protein GLOIN_2v1639675 [Rhizophagus clarus]
MFISIGFSGVEDRNDQIRKVLNVLAIVSFLPPTLLQIIWIMIDRPINGYFVTTWVAFLGIYTARAENFAFLRSTWRKVLQSKIVENKMPPSVDNDIVSLNFHYRNAENKNIIFALEISKDKKRFYANRR